MAKDRIVATLETIVEIDPEVAKLEEAQGGILEREFDAFWEGMAHQLWDHAVERTPLGLGKVQIKIRVEIPVAKAKELGVYEDALAEAQGT